MRRTDLTTLMCRLSRNQGASASWNPQGLSRPKQGLVSSYDVLFLQLFKGCSRLERLLLIPILRYGTERGDVAVKDLTQDCHYTTL